MSRRRSRPFAALAVVGALAVGGVACSDEDGDSATTDEEVDQVEDVVEDGADEVEEGVDQLEEEIDQGADEVEGNS